MVLFVIEHLEPTVSNWCILEYKHIVSFLKEQHKVLFTNTSSKKLAEFCEIEQKKAQKLEFENACVLDPSSEILLTPEIAAKHKTFIFGGILGDYPPLERTKEELKTKYPRYNLGKEQMSTDTAVLVTKEIVEGKSLNQLEFVDSLTIPTGDSEEVHLPYQYLQKEGKTIVAPGLIKMLKTQEDF